MSQEQENKNERHKVYDVIAYCPGLYASKIAELLNIKIVEVLRYLESLKEEKMIYGVTKKGYEQFYVISDGATPRELQSQDIRKQIFELIAKNPGLHLSRVAERIHVSVTLADYYLSYMERQREIFSVKDEKGYHKRYYLITGDLGRSDKRILDLLSRRIPLKVVLLLLRHQVLRHRDLLKYVKVAPSTLSYHLSLLVECGILIQRGGGESIGYVLVNRQELIRLLKKHEFHIEVQLAAEGMHDMWDDFHY